MFLRTLPLQIEDEGNHGNDETRLFILSSLAQSQMSRVACILCEEKLLVFDRYPLVDGSFFLSPKQHSSGCIEVSQDLPSLSISLSMPPSSSLINDSGCVTPTCNGIAGQTGTIPCPLWVAFTAHVPRTFKVQLAYVVVANLTKKRRVGGSKRKRSTCIGGHKSKVCPSTNYGKSKMHIWRALREILKGVIKVEICIVNK